MSGESATATTPVSYMLVVTLELCFDPEKIKCTNKASVADFKVYKRTPKHATYL